MPEQDHVSRSPLPRRVTAFVAVIVLAAAGTIGIAKAYTSNATPYSPTGRYANGALIQNGRLVKPYGALVPLGDFPTAIAVAPAGDIAVVANTGQGEGSNPDQQDESLQVVDLGSNQVVQTVSDRAKGKDAFYNTGLAFSPDGSHLYASGGGNDAVYDYAVTNGRLSLTATWSSTRKAGLPQAPEAADINGYSRDLTVSHDGSTVFVSNEQGGSVTALSTSDGTIAWETQLPGNTGFGPYPAGTALSPDGTRLFVTAQGQNVVYTLDPTSGAVRGTTPVGDHPVAIRVTKDGSLAFVANDNDDTVSVLDLSAPVPTQAAQVSVHLIDGEANGTSPNAVAIDETRKLVYVADAGDDVVAVLGSDAATAPASWSAASIHVLGFIPAAYYPSAVAVVPADGSVLAVSAKGYGGVPVTRSSQYDGNDMVGLLNRAPAPTPLSLDEGTRAARDDLAFSESVNDERPADNPIPDAAHAGQSPIKHVVLVVRENRTFDQVLGDLPSGEADVDPQYLEFGRTDAAGETVTPNAHDIVSQFATSDNFYSDGDASIQGHHWTALGIASDYTERAWLGNYSSRNHPYDPTMPVTYPRCGAIFQQLALAGKTFKNFGELEGLTTSQAPAAPAPGAACAVPGGIADGVSVANHDSAGGNNLTLTTVKDTFREAEMEKILGPDAQALPAFTYVTMGNDHTGGGVAGRPTPQAQVATNDLAVGKLVDYLSHTSQWSSTAVFVEEDDSQDGLDHRDGHRNVLLVASPYVRHGFISHEHISQASIMRTIELILGLQPISSYSQTAPVPYEMFTAAPDLSTYTAETPTYPIDATNPNPFYGTPSSVPVDLRLVDLAGPMLEAQIWWATNPGKPMPAQLIAALRMRGGVKQQAIDAWARGRACTCSPLLPGLKVAPGFGDTDG